MSIIIEAGNELICPECKAVLPVTRSKTPWCECGWSSVTEEWVSQNIPTQLRRMLVRDRRRAQKLADIDKRASNLLSHKWGRLLWNLYLTVTVFLCIPILVIKYILFGIVLLAWGYTVYLRIPILIGIMTIVILGIVAYQWLTRSEKETIGIMLNRQIAPMLYEMLDEVASQNKISYVSSVILQLNGYCGIRQKLAGFVRPRIGTELHIGLIDLFAINLSQMKSILAHEFGHVKQKDTLVGMFIIFNALNTIQNWLTPGPGAMALLSFLPLFILLWLYFRLLMFVTRWAMRRQEYFADMNAVQLYGKSTFQQTLIASVAAHIAYEEYVPTIYQQIENNFDRRDFYAQFVNYWENMREDLRQKYYARAVASFNSVYDTHPTYRDRVKVLGKMANLPDIDVDTRPAISVLPNAGELGRELTLQIYKKYRL